MGLLNASRFAPARGGFQGGRVVYAEMWCRFVSREEYEDFEGGGW